MAKGARHWRTDTTKAESGASPLTAAAAALEAEIARFDDLAATIRRMPLNSRKNLERAARTLQEASGYDETIGGRLRTLLEAVNTANERLRASAAIIGERSQAISDRNREYGEVIGRFVALGEEARQLNTIAQEIVAVGPGQVDGEQRERVGARCAELCDRMSRVADEAAGLARAADAKDMSDLAREADTLKQQIVAARNKLVLFRQSLATS
jgi:VIT1/CCC1 family predicted Fe2+/Mn2+ transporter